MTKTQIEELERAFPPVGRGDTVTLTMTRAEHGHVRRLLEERKRLLEALTVAVALREGAIYDVNGVPSGMLRAAVAFAEAPADWVAERPKAT